MREKKLLTEQEWVYQYVQNSNHPLPVVMGTKGTWGKDGNPWIILIAGSYEDLMVMCDIHETPHSHIRRMTIHDLVYYAASITDPATVKQIMHTWADPENEEGTS
ncbi:hypothetical protein [Ammoniphilus sp. CFH 90114]|uniref:hypothetical protein n=1 Tax=Ammoniphilus sp. CFH 90114 TaxID=2493665 RepID=UPI00100DEA24|nr:hypothetical protein [Ammoniphilus sp. CFH 90114]RXT03820.1 hypothetical protein EIZ39_22850 [Ammoniphilus sp. CFH 90114]